MRRNYSAEVNRQSGQGIELERARISLGRSLAATDREREKASDLLLKDWDDPRMMEKVVLGKMKTLDDRQAGLVKELAAVEEQLRAFKMRGLDLDATRQALANIKPLLEVAGEAEKAQLLGLLVRQIELHPGGTARVLLYSNTPLVATSSCQRSDWLPGQDSNLQQPG